MANLYVELSTERERLTLEAQLESLGIAAGSVRFVPRVDHMVVTIAVSDPDLVIGQLEQCGLVVDDCSDWNWGRLYGAQVLNTQSPWGYIQHLRVWRHDGGDGIGWDVLQAIKDDMIGADALAIELYPPRHEVVNDANIRHLWVVPQSAVPISLKR